MFEDVYLFRYKNNRIRVVKRDELILFTFSDIYKACGLHHGDHRFYRLPPSTRYYSYGPNPRKEVPLITLEGMDFYCTFGRKQEEANELYQWAVDTVMPFFKEAALTEQPAVELCTKEKEGAQELLEIIRDLKADITQVEEDNQRLRALNASLADKVNKARAFKAMLTHMHEALTQYRENIECH